MTGNLSVAAERAQAAVSRMTNAVREFRLLNDWVRECADIAQAYAGQAETTEAREVATQIASDILALMQPEEEEGGENLC